MKIVHIRADGSKVDSIKGVVIKNEEFYRVLEGIMERKAKP